MLPAGDIAGSVYAVTAMQDVTIGTDVVAKLNEVLPYHEWPGASSQQGEAKSEMC